MGKKHDKKQKKKVVLSLAEFNEDAGIGGVDPELSALPSAPKPAEEWEAQGGRPEYNSRGYKERKSYADRNYDADVDFEDRDWVRKGPLDSEQGNTFGLGGPDRDWGDVRRGPIDGPDDEQPERDWNGMRRGPVESAFDSAPAERNWGARRGPVEADLGKARAVSDDNWGSARGNAVEAEFPDAQKERDWGVRKGPVEADLPESAKEADWTARKGPVESEFAIPEAERDWTQRKGPIEAVASKPVEDADWTSRKGPVEAEVPDSKPEVTEPDWKARRGPIETEVATAQKAVRDIDFGDMRRGARLQELEKKDQPTPTKPEREERWRRDSARVVGRRGPVETRERPASTGHDAAAKDERDWGAARRTQPVRAISRTNRSITGRVSDVSETSDTPQADAQDSNANEKDDDWTTVRSAASKRQSGSGNRRFGKREGQGSFPQRGGREMPSHSNKATSSPVTPVASAVSES